jgi:hypothetical protein
MLIPKGSAGDTARMCGRSNLNDHSSLTRICTDGKRKDICSLKVDAHKKTENEIVIVIESNSPSSIWKKICNITKNPGRAYNNSIQEDFYLEACHRQLSSSG